MRITNKLFNALINQLLVMLKAGIPLLQIFNILIKTQTHSQLNKILRTVKSELRSGVSLSEAFAQHPTIFDNLLINFLALGEAGGILDILLEKYLNYLNNSNQIKKKITAALSYPILVSIMATIVLTIVLVLIIPQFEQIFIEFGAKLPNATLTLITISKIIIHYWGLLLLIPISLILIYRLLYKNLVGFKLKMDKIYLKIPLIGTLAHKIIISRWSNTLALLISVGIPLNQCLRLSGKISNNYFYNETINQIQCEIESGVSFYLAVEEQILFPNFIKQMILIGEESGKLEYLLTVVADFYDNEIETTIANILLLIEPIAISLLGIILGAIIIAIYLPIFNLGGVIA